MKINTISAQEFEALIPPFREQYSDTNQVIDTLHTLIESSIKELPDQKIGILFSGGIDSSVLTSIIKKQERDSACVGVGFYDENMEDLVFPEDIEKGKKIAKLLKAPYTPLVLTFAQVEEEVKKTLSILGTDFHNLVVNVAVGCVEHIGISFLKKQGCSVIVSGLGSEELFAGYHRHKKGNDVLANCEQGLRQMYERDIKRLKILAQHHDVEIHLPFLHKELVDYASQIALALKISEGYEKYCLRKAFEHDLPLEVLWRKKKAAQYGSRIDSAIKKLKNRNDFDKKKDYVLSLIS